MFLSQGKWRILHPESLEFQGENSVKESMFITDDGATSFLTTDKWSRRECQIIPGKMRPYNSPIYNRVAENQVVSLDSVDGYEQAISVDARCTLLMHDTRSSSGGSHGVHHMLLKPTVSLVVTSAVVCTYGCDDGRIAPTRCAIIDAGLDGRYSLHRSYKTNGVSLLQTKQ